MARYRLSRLRRGTRPAEHLGDRPAWPRRFRCRSRPPITAISARMKASMVRMPKLWNQSSSSVSAAVSSTPDEQRNVEQQVEPDGRAQHLGQVAGGDGDFAQHPQRQGDAPRIGFAAGLRQVAAGDDAQARAQGLQQDGHGVGHHQHPEQAVAEARAAFQVGGPVAGVHVADADQVGRPGEGEHAPPERHLGRADAGVDVGQRARVLPQLSGSGHELNYS